MGSYDKLVRLLAAIALIILYYKGTFTNQTLGIVALVLALVFTLTSLIGFCPLYTLFGIKTCKKEEK